MPSGGARLPYVMDSETTDTQASPTLPAREVPSARKKSSCLLVAVILILLLLAGVAGAYFWYNRPIKAVELSKQEVEAVEAKMRNSEPDFRGKITVDLSATETDVIVVVEDNGVGLPQEGERIVEPYVTTRDKGTGLGLAIVNKIVEEHGGELTFSTAESGGTNVSLRFARDPMIEIDQHDGSGGTR